MPKKLQGILLKDKGLENLPEINLKKSDLEKGVSILELLSNNRVVSSKSEARRLILNNGLKINNILVNEEKKILKINDFRDKNFKISLGKKKHFIVNII